MEINGITIPEESSTKQYIADPIGGWMYIVTTNVSVEQTNLASFKERLSNAHAQLEQAQALVAELEPEAQAFELSLKDTKITPEPVLNATSTPAISPEKE